MTTGVLIFAFNNEHIDYLAMSAWSAKNIHRHLKLPVCVVTDVETIPQHYEFDQVVFAQSRDPSLRHFDDLACQVTWKNTNRVDSYHTTPWDVTLVLDSDYVVASNQLNILFDTGQDFLAHRWAYDITGSKAFEGNNYFGQHSMPMWWATVMMFRRSQQTELLFETMTMIRENWNHYRHLYHNPKSTYRNDHALSIALNIVNGHTLNHHGIPWNLASVPSSHQLTELGQDCYQVNFTNSLKQQRRIEIHNQDFHAMGKGHLGAIVANNI
jgi:hypothetical protein